ncbi:hypothetical protein [uncultured Chryseobacterium sp.]|uniref:hypothetical protein n=1 Tax=uncultured Chryseobacterium sp. TaxID=259322 RepID=UPI0025CDA962|nr:hypothetical protein [uncultured Chryseobacterium sp.]
MKKIFSYRPGGLFSGDYRSFTGGIIRVAIWALLLIHNEDPGADHYLLCLLKIKA